MGLPEILTLITGVLKFPAIILEFIKLLQKTPQENHDDLLKKIKEEADHFEKTGRPEW